MNNQTMIFNYTMTSIPNEIWLGMLPILFLSLGALVTLLTAPSKNGQKTSFIISLISLMGAFMASLFNFYNLSIPLSYADGMLMFDSLTLFSTSALCLGAILSSFNFYGNAVGKDQIQNEIFPLLLLSLIGMLFLVSTNHLIMMFVALEIMSLAVYVLVSMRRTTKVSSEAGLKYFIMGGAASCFFLYGSALLLGHYGSFNLMTLSQAESSSLLTLVGSMLILLAVLFKIGAFPLHAWVPDVYQGAASPITGFMAATVKFTGFLLLLRITEALFTSPFFIVIGIVAILTMIYGNVMALRQENLKRMMAYSSIAHTGYILIGLLAAEENLIIGHQAILVYLTLYLFSSLGVFAILSLFPDDTTLDDIRGLGLEHPYLGLALCLFMLSFAGIPLTSGFIGKYLLFSAAIISGTPLTLTILIVAIITSLISLGYYLPVITALFNFRNTCMLGRKEMASKLLSTPLVKMSLAVIVITVVITLTLGILPMPLLDLAKN